MNPLETVSNHRLSTGITKFDEALGGGLLPGTLTVLVGATGIGKTQFGMHFAHQGIVDEGNVAAIVDLCSRGDSQSHASYFQRMFRKELESKASSELIAANDLLPGDMQSTDRLVAFPRSGLRTGRQQIDQREWDEWQSQVNRNLNALVGFLYHQFVGGCRRVVVDGFEPADEHSESIQFELFEYIYHQVLRKEYDWLARDLYREKFRQVQEKVSDASYDHEQIACVALCTSHHSMLDQLIREPLQNGDLLANANTLIYLGKVARGDQIQRAFYIAKHRGSACSDSIHTYTIGEDGISVE